MLSRFALTCVITSALACCCWAAPSASDPVQIQGSAVAVSTDLRYAASARADKPGTVELWQLSTRTKINELAIGMPEAVSATAFSAGSELLIAATDAGSIVAWRLPEGERFTSIRVEQFNHPIDRLTVSPHRKFVAANSTVSGTILVADLEQGSIVSTFSTDTGPMLQTVFSPDDSSLVVVTGQAVWQWDADRPSDPKIVYRPDGGVPFRQVTVDPSGRLLVVAGGKGLEIWSVAPFQSHSPLYLAAGADSFGSDYPPTFAMAGKKILTRRATERREERVIDVWDVSSGAANAVIEQTFTGVGVGAVALSNDGRYVAYLDCTDRERCLIVRDLYTRSAAKLGKNMRFFDRARSDELTAAVFSPDSKRLYSVWRDGLARVWDVADGLIAGPTCPAVGLGSTLQITPDEEVLVVADVEDKAPDPLSLSLWSLVDVMPVIPHQVFRFAEE